MIDYDAVYRENPQLWTGSSLARNSFAFNVLEKPGVFLDLGCGSGETLAYFSERWPDVQYIGVDVSQVAIDLAKARAPSATFIHGLIQDVDDIQADLITLMGVAEHFQDLEDLERVKDMLTQDGTLYLEVPNCLSYANSKEEGFRKEGRQHEWHLKRETWETVIKDNGFRIAKSLTGDRPAWEFIWLLRK